MTFTQLRELVNLLNRSTSGKDGGHSLVGRFLRCRSDLRSKVGTKIGRKIDHTRIENSDPILLQPWFDCLHTLMRRIGVYPFECLKC